MARPWMLSLAFVATLATSGCRTVYVHPEATAATFHRDQTRCQYGLSPEEFERAVSTPGQPLPAMRRDWKRCMAALGWDTRTEFRSAEPWARR